MAWKIWSYASEDGKEVRFKFPNCLLCCIFPVHVRRERLELNFPPVSNGCLVLLATFIVQNVKVNKEIFLLQPLHYGIVSCQPVLIFSLGKRLNYNNI